MSPEPTFPSDAFPGDTAPLAPADTKPAAPRSATDDDAPRGPIAEPESGSVAGGEASATQAAAAVKSVAARLWPTGVAIGVGSAAIAAALLYRSRR